MKTSRRAGRLAWILCASVGLARAADPAQQMVDGIGEWLKLETARVAGHGHATRERLRYIIGAVDDRVPFDQPELTPLREEPAFKTYAIRWPVLEGVHGEGVLYRPAAGHEGKGAVVALPDADQEPEDLAIARRWAAEGKTVLVPVLIDRRHTWSGNPRIGKTTTEPHREYIYRMAYELGRHIIGYEVEKVQAAVDWLAKTNGPIELWGYGEGGVIAMYAAALDPRIGRATVSGCKPPGPDLWQEPLYRNVWSVLRDFGDGGLASLCRKLVLETAPDPLSQPAVTAPERNAARMHRQLQELVDYTQKLVRGAAQVRADYWTKAGAEAVRERLRGDVIGRLPAPTLPMNPRIQESYHGAKWDGYEVWLDLYPGVFAYGVLLKPKDIRPGERRPVVVAQHGLQGRPQFLFDRPETDTQGFRAYQNYGAKLADLGFVVFMPQNPYIGEFRHLARQANPIQLSIYSFIVAQSERILDWLATLPYVDSKRIGYYGLSYGGKTALRIPALADRFALSICSGDFNEWVVKVSTVDYPWSYVFSQEYEMPEFNMGGVASHAEMAMLIAPRPFMVERGHRDGVGVDEWVAYEFAKVRRYYDEGGIGDRARIEFFNGPHQIHGVGTFEFLRQFLNWR